MSDPGSLVLDLRIAHDRYGSSSDPSLNGHLRYPNDIDRSLDEDDTDKVRKYRTDYNNNPPNTVSFMSSIASTSGRLHSEFVRLLICQTFIQFHYRHESFSSHLKSKVGNILANAAAQRIVLNIDGAPIPSKSHTHPSHSQTSRLLTSSLSLGVPVTLTTQCIRDV